MVKSVCLSKSARISDGKLPLRHNVHWLLCERCKKACISKIGDQKDTDIGAFSLNLPLYPRRQGNNFKGMPVDIFLLDIQHSSNNFVSDQSHLNWSFRPKVPHFEDVGNVKLAFGPKPDEARCQWRRRNIEQIRPEKLSYQFFGQMYKTKKSKHPSQDP